MHSILYVIGTMHIGGAERHLFKVASALSRRGYQIEVFALDPNGPMLSLYHEKGIPVRGFYAPNRLKKAIRSKRLFIRVSLFISSIYLFFTLWKKKPHTIHFFLPAAYIIGGMVSLFTPAAKRVMSRRSLNTYHQKHKHFAFLERWLHPKMDVVTGNSLAVITQLKEEGIPQDKLRLIYNGIELHDPMPEVPSTTLKNKLGIQPDCIVLTMVANLIPYKGHADLIEACYTIKDKLSKPWVILLIGRDDGILNGLNEQINRFGLSQHVHFLGERTDVLDLLAISDIGLLCSHEEGFSNALLESMSMSLPMIVTDVGGNAEAVIDGVTGLVVPPKQPDQLGEAILWMIENPNRVEMGKKGRDRVAKEYSMTGCLEGYHALYKTL